MTPPRAKKSQKVSLVRLLGRRILLSLSRALLATSERVSAFANSEKLVRTYERPADNLGTPNNTEATLSRGIVITTFSERFFSDCLPLVRELRSLGLTDPIYCVINGDWQREFDQVLRQAFLAELCEVNACFPICLGTPHGMSSMWNTGIRLCNADLTLVLNDDLTILKSNTSGAVSELYRLARLHGLVTLNRSFGHFAISRECIHKVGWFDERFVAISHEDGDYAWRYIEAFRKSHHNVDIPSLHNRVAKSGYKFAGSPEHKGSYFNDAFLLEKYRFGAGQIQGLFGEPAERVLGEVSNYPLDSWRERMIPKYTACSRDAVTAMLRRELYGIE